jgi:hypothetical protein
MCCWLGAKASPLANFTSSQLLLFSAVTIRANLRRDLNADDSCALALAMLNLVNVVA